MTRLLHTADLHLSEEHPERWEALEAILSLAGERAVDAILVAGDALDRGEDAHALRSRLRTLLAGTEATVLLLPGNHDVDAYRAGQDWGPRTTLLLQRPVGTDRSTGIPLVFVPFPAEPVAFAALRPALDEEARRAGPGAILVLHATLLGEGEGRLLRESQEDEPGPYLPVRLEALAELPFAYVAAGHYHQKRVWRDPRLVAYPGSPAPIGPHALGPRSVLLVEAEETSVALLEEVELPVGYRRRHEVWLRPFQEEEDLRQLEFHLRESADPRCALRVRVDGVLTGLTEADLRTRIDGLESDLGPRFARLEIEPHGVGLEPGFGEIFAHFLRELEQREREAESEGRPLSPLVSRRALQLAAEALKRGR